MKKMIALTLAALLLLSLAACGKNEETVSTAPSTGAAEQETTQAAPETEAAPTEPDWQPGTARAGYGELIYTTFSQGQEVNVIGQWNNYYVVHGEEVDLLVDMQYIRLSGEEPFVQWTGYAKYNTKAYDNVQMTGEPLATLYQNKAVTVLEGKGGWLQIQWDDQTGYVDADQISRWPISSGSSKDDGEGGGSSSGGSSGPSGDINLDLIAYYGPEKTDLQGTGIVLADNTPGALTITVRGDTLKVVSLDAEVCQIYMEGFMVTAPRWLVFTEGDDAYESWTGYTRWNTVIYEEYQMRTEITTLNTNQQVLVIDELENCYIVELEDGRIGYAQLDKVSPYRYSAGGGSRDSDGGSSSGGGGGSSGDSGIWTPPIS